MLGSIRLVLIRQYFYGAARIAMRWPSPQYCAIAIRQLTAPLHFESSDSGKCSVENQNVKGDRIFGLSKSRITSFEQCPKKLWLSVHKRELAETQAGSELRFAGGHEVGAIACELALGGVMIEAQPDLHAALKQTLELLAAGHRVPIYEATFSHDGVLIQADVLEPAGESSWRMAEVKSSTGVKDYHRGDLATQVWVLEHCGIKLEAAAIRHIDNSFVLRTPGDYRGLLIDAPLLEEVRPIAALRGEVAASARETLAGSEPSLSMGPHCLKPFSCEFQAYCSKEMPPPPEWPIDILPRVSRSFVEEMAQKGIYDLRDVPLDALKNSKHKIVYQATVSGLPYHDPAGVADETRDWDFPRHYLDFETIALPVPAWVGTKPYQQVPFQFSCHTELADGNISHRSFLSVDGCDPRRQCAEALIECVGEAGSIIAYNASFERSCVKGLADALADLSSELTAIAERFVDLLPVAQAHYYHRDQRGSWSIKKVLPTIAPDLDYSDLEVGDGVAAQLAWLEARSEQCTPERRGQIAASLEAYCERDTLAMVILLRRMIERTA